MFKHPLRSGSILRILLAVSIVLTISLPSTAVTPQLLKERPKLILTIVIDQFRGDYLTRFNSRFLPAVKSDGTVGGFNYLMTRGAYFPYGEFEMLQDMTGPGHATILTGSYPYQAGIPLNNWYDKATGEGVYCTEDPGVAVIGRNPEDKHFGTSPKNLIATTVGDEFKNAGLPSKVVSISLKDRAAILMGGHRADVVMWFDTKATQWVSSKYYFPSGRLPNWIDVLNGEILGRTGKVVEWNVTGKPTGLSTDNNLLRDEAIHLGKFGKSFPHRVELGTKRSLGTPVGLDITNAAVEKAIDEYHLGKGKGTDLLAVSYSSHDYLGHAFGPNSLEMEEMTVAEDRSLSRILNYIKRKVPGGLAGVVVVLTGDHGIPPNPDSSQIERNRCGSNR